MHGRIGIDAGNVSRASTGMMACQACGTCPWFYRFELTVNASGMQPLLDEGWTRE